MDSVRQIRFGEGQIWISRPDDRFSSYFSKNCTEKCISVRCIDLRKDIARHKVYLKIVIFSSYSCVKRIFELFINLLF